MLKKMLITGAGQVLMKSCASLSTREISLSRALEKTDERASVCRRPMLREDSHEVFYIEKQHGSTSRSSCASV